MRECVSPGPDRDHTITRYTDQIYKITQWVNGRPMRYGPGPRDKHKHSEVKLDSSVSRTRRLVLEKALCNKWDYFVTCTLDENKGDRFDLDAWMKKFTQWLRDERKKGNYIKYLLVPERHENGAWHAHGFLAGIPEDQLISFRDLDRAGYRSANGRRLPVKLRKSKYKNWPAYQKKFGFCSLGRLRNPVAAAFYVTKYITKERERMVSTVGKHSFCASRPLAGAVQQCEFYGRYPEIDKFLVNDYDYVRTGMTHLADQLDWSFALEYENPELIPEMESLRFDEGSGDPDEDLADDFYEFEQMVLASEGYGF